jgi:hypothetical protein
MRGAQRRRRPILDIHDVKQRDAASGIEVKRLSGRTQ